MPFLCTAVANLVTLGACASVDVIQVAPNDVVTPGIRVPERRPLISIAGGKVDVIWVCNYDRPSALNFRNFLAKHHVIVDFDGCGAISKIDSDSDTTAVPLKLLDLIKSAIPSGVTTSGSTNNGTQGLTSIQIFDVIFAADGAISLRPLLRSKDFISIRTSASTATGQTFAPQPQVANQTPQAGAQSAAKSQPFDEVGKK